MNFLVFVALVFFFENALGQKTIYTPNEKSINISSDFLRYNPPSDDDINSWIANLGDSVRILLQPPYIADIGDWPGYWKYNCHFYAWHNSQGHEQWTSEPDSVDRFWKSGEPDTTTLAFLGDSKVEWY